MRTLNKNKQLLKYAVKTGKVPIYEKDEDGNVRYIMVDGKAIPVPTGDFEDAYSEPISFYANISLSGGEVTSEPFGIDVSNYDATIVLNRNALRINENAIIWHKTEVAYKDIDKTIVDPNSADYRVKKVTPSLNQEKYLLERILK